MLPQSKVHGLTPWANTSATFDKCLRYFIIFGAIDRNGPGVALQSGLRFTVAKYKA
jgi:hypothetical protein